MKRGTWAGAVLFVVVLAGCSDAPPGNPPGEKAGENKVYSKDEASNAQPQRGSVLKEKDGG
jgi:hypothetical protein